MRRELIIEPYGLGNAVVVRDSGEIVDLFLDPPSYSNIVGLPLASLMGVLSTLGYFKK